MAVVSGKLISSVLFQHGRADAFDDRKDMAFGLLEVR